MSAPIKLAAFGIMLAVIFVAGLVVGSIVGPITVSDGPSGHGNGHQSQAMEGER